jgi:hypothetical protein
VKYDSTEVAIFDAYFENSFSSNSVVIAFNRAFSNLGMGSMDFETKILIKHMLLRQDI